MIALVTGGKGFIGSVLVDKLIKLNYEVRVIDHKEDTGRNSKARYFTLDLKNLDSILPIFKDVNVVFHMAADVSIHKSFLQPVECGYNNLMSTHNVLEASRLNKINRVIFSSTSAVYEDSGLKVNEQSTINPKNIYSASKLYGENLCKIYREYYNLETIVLRYFNVFGVKQEQSEYASVITSFLNRKKSGDNLLIFGDGTQSRDFIFVEDVAEANILAIKVNINDGQYTYNIGSGTSTRIIDIAQLLSSNIKNEAQRAGEIFYSCADNTLALTKLKWSPTVNVLNWINNLM